jgi:hypothetical protein
LPLIVLAACLTGCASLSSRAPRWATVQPQGFQYAYVVGTGSGSDLRAAREAALENAYQMLVRTGPRAYRSAQFRQEFETVTEEALGGGGALRSDGRQRLRTEGTLQGDIAGQSFPRLEIVATETGTCRNCGVTSWILLRYLKPPSERRNPPWQGTYVAKSIVVPGWGQFAKGEPTKGWTVLAGTMAGAGAALAGDYVRHRMLDSAARATSQSERTRYLNAADRYRTGVIGAATLGVVFYGYGVLDAMLGPVRLYPMVSGGSGLPTGVRLDVTMRTPWF